MFQIINYFVVYYHSSVRTAADFPIDTVFTIIDNRPLSLPSKKCNICSSLIIVYVYIYR